MKTRTWLFLVALFSLPALAAPSQLEDSAKAYTPPSRPGAAVEFNYFMPVFGSYGATADIERRKPGMGFRLGFDWMPLVGRAGKLGLGLGIGYGKTQPAGEGLTRMPFLEAYPLDADLVYRFDYVDNQLLVPFVRAGANVTYLFEEFRPGLQRFTGYYYGGGLALCLDFLDAVSAELLNTSTGIDNTYLLVQYRRVENFTPGQGPQLQRDEFSASFRMEF